LEAASTNKGLLIEKNTYYQNLYNKVNSKVDTRKLKKVKFDCERLFFSEERKQITYGAKCL